MTHAALDALVREEVRHARLRLRFEIRRAATGCFLLLWSDFCWTEGFGGRRVFAHDEGVRNREMSIGVLALHSRVPTITFGAAIAADDPLQTLYPPPRCPELILRALVAHAIAQTAPTPRRLREARRRMREAGLRLAEFGNRQRL